MIPHTQILFRNVLNVELTKKEKKMSVNNKYYTDQEFVFATTNGETTIKLTSPLIDGDADESC